MVIIQSVPVRSLAVHQNPAARLISRTHILFHDQKVSIESPSANPIWVQNRGTFFNSKTLGFDFIVPHLDSNSLLGGAAL